MDTPPILRLAKTRDKRALSVITASHDGREPETRLSGAVLTALQLDEVDDLDLDASLADSDSDETETFPLASASVMATPSRPYIYELGEFRLVEPAATVGIEH